MQENHRQDLIDVFEEIFNTLAISLEQRLAKYIREEVKIVTQTQIVEIINDKLETQRAIIIKQLEKDVEAVINKKKKSRFWKWK